MDTRLIPAMIILVILAPMAARAQIDIFGGFCFPLGEFSSTAISSGTDFLNRGGRTPGFAQTGFAGGLEYSLRLHSPYEIGILTNISINGIDDGALRRISRDFSSNVTSSPWYLYSVMLSGGIAEDITPDAEVDGRIYGGFTGGTSAEFTFLNINGNGGYRMQKSTLGSAFGYGVGAGITFHRSWQCAIRYLAANPEYAAECTDGRENILKNFTQSSGTLSLTLGFFLK